MKVWEGKLMRRIYGGLREGEEWIKQINQEVMTMYNQPLIRNFV
jgi:hypothetical protein